MTNSTNWPAWLPLREPLKPMSPYGAPQVPASAQLNTNENPFAPSTELVAAIAKRVGEVSATLNRYPDRDAIALRAALANYMTQQTGVALEVANLWAANGSNEIIQSIFLAFGRESALGFTPSYSMHPLIAKVTSVNWLNGKRRDDHSLDIAVAAQEVLTARPTLTFITTPNNPTGSVVTISEILELAKAAATVGGLLVVDEAYAEFSSELSAVTLIAQYPNVIVIRTMSKAFAFAGARLGYLIADSAVIDALQLVRLPYHLSAITQAVAEVALSFSAELLAGVDTLIAQREIVQAELTKLGLSITPSAGNFLLFGGFNHPADQIWRKLLDRGILIRDVGLLGQLRVTIGTAAENQAFLTALTEVLAEVQVKGDK
jgi:histidinol-phosphate aminotransferase